jgi:uncharacterized membrane protein
MSDVRSRYDRVFRSEANPERLAFFSDAVFAIALTLLVIDIRVPEDASGTAWEVLTSEWPALLAYALSFAIIALNWRGHYRKFLVLRAHDSRLMTYNLALLFFVALIPFPTSLLSTYGAEPAAVITYAFVVGLLSVIQYVMWRHAWTHGLIDRTRVDEGMYRYASWNLLSTPAVFWATIPVALFWSGAVATYLWFLLIPANIVASRLGRWSAARAMTREGATPASGSVEPVTPEG